MTTKRNYVRISAGLIGAACLAISTFSTTTAAVGEFEFSLPATQDAAASRGAAIKVSAQVKTPDIIAVRVHHDMCPFCKQLDPQFAKLTRQTNNGSVLFVTLDLTNAATQQQAALLVGALGLEGVWTGDLSRLATITFVDGTSKRVVSSVRAVDEETMRVMNAKTLQAALRKAVKSSRDKR